MICDRRGNPLWFTLTPGNIHDATAFSKCFESFLIRMNRMGWRVRLRFLVGDKGYDSSDILAICRRHDIEPVIPKRKTPQGKERPNPGFDKAKYRCRNVVERCIGGHKEQRRIAMRFDKLAETYAGMINLGSIRRLLRVVAA